MGNKIESVSSSFRISAIALPFRNNTQRVDTVARGGDNVLETSIRYEMLDCSFQRKSLATATYIRTHKHFIRLDEDARKRRIQSPK